MTTIEMSQSHNRSSVLLLKTRSTPIDTYEDKFSKEPFSATFVPVLEHKPVVSNLAVLRSLLLDGQLGRHHNAKYGGMIFTSQRAVEEFAKVVAQIEADDSQTGHRLESLQNQKPNGIDSAPTTPLPLYVVGPATFRTLTSVLSTSSQSRNSVLAPLQPQIFGSQTGNGGALAHYILEHYNTLAGPGHTLPLLFLVGEQRRDIIPNTLMNPSLPNDKQIRVDELIVYETGVMESFAMDFASHVSRIESETQHGAAAVVVVVFSPSGCEDMLKCLGYIDDDNRLTEKGKRGGSKTTKEVGSQPDVRTRYIITTIGPTTRDYLRREFGFEADVCAEVPSPEGIADGVKKLLAG